MPGTLYLSDLDGTLLGKDQRVSAYTCETVNRLVRGGALFSYATARSAETAQLVARGLELRLPVIVHNGAFIVRPQTREILSARTFSAGEKEEIFSAFRGEGLFPVCYTLLGGRPRFSYNWEQSGKAQREFLLTRLGDGRARAVREEARALDGTVYYFACIDAEEKLRPVCGRLKEKYRCYLSRDIYTGEAWLEVSEREASKASAALALKEMCGCDRLVCFGDAVNDIPLFEAADESYAVENADEALKARATGVIASCGEDGVARFLAARGI